MSDPIVVELQRRGKLLLGEPFFTPGTPIVVDGKGVRDAGPGDLAVLRPGRGRARLEQVLGKADDVEAVLDALLVQEGERRGFEPHELPEATLEGRTDLRDLVSFTIDPETAKDFDDAISVVREGDGMRAWVHIADVAHFVPAGTPLDRGAARRAFSVYVPGRVAPMLPPDLSEEACSLRPYVDRLTLTVEIPFDAELRPGEPLFYRSVIRSNERFTYARVEEALTGRAGEQETLIEELRLAEQLTTELRRRRFARGALRIDTPELNLAFDGRGGVERAWFEGEAHAHMLVEELMVLANECVAQLLSSRRREALYRVHERPDPQSIGLLLAKLAELGVPTPPAPDVDEMSPGDASRVVAQVAERVTAYVQQSGRGREAFPALVLRSLKQARYHPQNLGHMGLASPAYCHFTSPIRRYPDLVVHRALLRELGAADDPPAEDLDELASWTSERERAAARIEYRADDIGLAWLLERVLFERGWDEPFDGEITGLIGSGLFVRFGEVFEGFLPVRRLRDDYYELDALGTQLQGRRGGGRYRLGDEVAVRVEDIRRNEGKVEVSPA
jgi:ribonuclease R